jgi:hypothetical protein
VGFALGGQADSLPILRINTTKEKTADSFGGFLFVLISELVLDYSVANATAD